MDSLTIINNTAAAVVTLNGWNRADFGVHNFKPALSLFTTLRELIEQTESENKEQKMSNLAAYVKDMNITALGLITKNIIDLNIIPINIHAMMRDIPMANILNYSYNFDKIVGKILYEDTGFADYVSPLAGPFINNKDKRFFQRLMANPYRQINANEYFLLMKFFMGVGNTILGRPKFLSDELALKVIFLDYYNTTFYNVDGPGAAIDTFGFDTLPMTAFINRNKVSKFKKVSDDPRALYDGKVMAPVIPRFLKSLQINDPAYLTELRRNGMHRFNTLFVRQLIFITNLQRIIRYKFSKELSYDRNLIVKSHAAIREDLTEFKGNQSRWDNKPDYDQANRAYSDYN